MDCSSPYAMARLIGMRDKFDVAFANDTDADRHGIVTALERPDEPEPLSRRRDRLSVRATARTGAATARWARPSSPARSSTASPKKLGRGLVETPVGFKWFVDGLSDGSFGFAGEESAGASFLRRDGSVWTTDKDGIILGLLAAEMTARTKSDPEPVVRRS